MNNQANARCIQTIYFKKLTYLDRLTAIYYKMHVHAHDTLEIFLYIKFTIF